MNINKIPDIILVQNIKINIKIKIYNIIMNNMYI